MKPRPTLRTALPLSFFLAAILPVLIMGYFTDHFVSERVIDYEKRESLSRTRLVASRVEQYLEEPLLLLKDRYARLMKDESWFLEKDAEEYLEGMVEGPRLFEAVVVLDKDGRVLDTMPRNRDLVGLDLSQTPCFRHRNGGAFHLSDSHVSIVTGRVSISMSLPLEAGVLVGYLNLDSFNGMLDRVRKESRGYGMVVDGKGVVLAHPDRSKVFERANLSALAPGLFGRRNLEEAFVTAYEGSEVLAGVAAVPYSDWSVILVEKTSEAFGVLKQVQAVFMFGVALTLLVAVITSGVSLSLTLRPLRNLMGMVQRVAGGHYDISPHVEVYQEFTALSQGLASMSTAIRERERLTRQSEERYRNIFENSAEGILIVHAETERFKFANPAACAMFGYSEPDLLRLGLADIHPPDSIDRVRREFLGARTAGQAVCRDIACVTGTGGLVFTDISSGLMAIDGEDYVIGFFTDITVRKRAEEMRIRLEALVEYSPNMVIMHSPDGSVLYANRVARETLGLSGVPYPNLAVYDLHPEDQRVRLEQEIRPALRDKGTWQGEFVARNARSGESLPVEYIGFSIHHGQPEGAMSYAAIMVDIRQRLRAEEAYRCVVDNAREGIAIIQDGRVRFGNEAATQLVGYTAEEMKEISFIDLVHPEDRPLVMERHRLRLSGEEVVSSYSLRVVRKDGAFRWVQVNVVVVEWEERPATLNFLTDITDRFELEEQLRHAQKMEAIGTLAGGIAHDFNNILSAILGYSQIAKMKMPENGPAQDDLDQVLLAGGRATELVQQILTFSRRDATEVGPLIMAPVIKEVMKLLRSSLPSTIEIRKRIETTKPVIADPVQVHQILMNLCTNAYHAMQDAGKGTLSVRLEDVELSGGRLAEFPGLNAGPHVRLEVTDTGGGIDPLVQGRIFEPYFTTKVKGKGTGLGLAMVHGIVRKWNGYIGFRSVPGQGTTFEVLLPAVDLQVTKAVRGDDILRRGNERVLCVDDEEAIVMVLKAILERLGYRVLAYSRAEDALELLRAAPEAVDIVITDLTMPGMTGIEFSREVHGLRPEMPIVMFTGYTEGVDERALEAVGIRKLVMKPVTRESLSTAIRAALEGGTNV